MRISLERDDTSTVLDGYESRLGIGLGVLLAVEACVDKRGDAFVALANDGVEVFLVENLSLCEGCGKKVILGSSVSACANSKM